MSSNEHSRVRTRVAVSKGSLIVPKQKKKNTISYNMMKIVSSFTLFIAMSLTTIIVSDDTRAALNSAKPLPTLVSSNGGVKKPMTPLFVRNLAMLDMCSLETDALYNTPILNTSYTAWETELLHEHASLGDNVCVAVAGNNRHFACALDSKKVAIASHVRLLDSCHQVGGTTFLESIDIHCMVTDYDGRNIAFDIRISQIPHCLAASSCIHVAQHDCGFPKRATQQYQESLAFLFQTAFCTSSAVRWSAWFGVMSMVTALGFLLV